MLEVSERDMPIKPGQLTVGNLEVRLAQDDADLDAIQALRYRVFYREMAAQPTSYIQASSERDFDELDPICDHLLVLDHKPEKSTEKIIGTYRLLRRSALPKGYNFYTSTEYNISRLLDYSGEVLELGRSCVDADYRMQPVTSLLWKGIAAYVFHYNIALMFGCASLPGTDIEALSLPLSYLYFFHLAPPALRTKALTHRHVDMRRMQKDQIEPQKALAVLPPLIKGYLRLGGFVGDGAVVDFQFNSTDVCVVVKTDLVTQKYYRHYKRSANPLEN